MTENKETDRPLVTFALFAYNQEKYIREAVEGAFSQTYEPLEIILSDDCSSDRTFEIMQEMVDLYDGPHLVRLNRNPRNLGLGGHVSTVLSEARGEIYVIAAGDDISLPERTNVSVNLFQKYPKATAVLLSAEKIDAGGHAIGRKTLVRGGSNHKILTLKDLLKSKHQTFGATRAIKSDVFAIFGNFRKDCPSEDTPFLVRSLLLGENILSSSIAVNYRIHENNLSGRNSVSKIDTSEIYNQYADDINIAAKAGLIDERIKNLLKSWTKRDKKIREIINLKIDGMKVGVRDMLYFSIFSNRSLKEKIHFIFFR